MCVASRFSHITRDQGRGQRWLTSRGEAEVARFDVFKEIARKAAERHRASSERTSLLSDLAAALAFVGGSGAIVASYSKDALWLVLAGAVGAALTAYAVNREALLRDRANSERYEKAGVSLDGLGRFYRCRCRSIVGRTQAVARGNRPS